METSQVLESHSLEDTHDLAQKVLSGLKPGKQATILALHGDLGSGKTSFTQGLAKALGVSDVVTSPTFIIQKIYHLPEGSPFHRLIHIDAYRFEQAEEVLALGWPNLIADPLNLVVVEWPENIQTYLPNNIWHLYFTFVSDGVRLIKYGQQENI